MVVNQAVGNLSVLENQDTPYSSDDNAEHVTTVTFKDDDPECPYNWSNVCQIFSKVERYSNVIPRTEQEAIHCRHDPPYRPKQHSWLITAVQCHSAHCIRLRRVNRRL